MARGLVIRMDNGRYKTPNHGILMDFETGYEYEFHRPDYTGSGSPPKWDVSVVQRQLRLVKVLY